MSRAKLLAELEEKRLENKEKAINLKVDYMAGSEPSGYDPYDHPGPGTAPPDAADITLRRRRILTDRKRR